MQPTAKRISPLRIAGLCTAAFGLLSNFIIYIISRAVKVMIPIEITTPTGESWQTWDPTHTGYNYRFFIQEYNLEFLIILFWLLVIAGLLVAFTK